MDKLQEVWHSLYRSGDHTIFQTFAWNRLAASWFSDREEPFVTFFEDDNGAALVPAAIQNGCRVKLLGERLFDYPDALAEGDSSALANAWRPIAELKLPLCVAGVRRSATGRWALLGPTPFCLAPSVRHCESCPEDLVGAHRRLGRFTRRLRKQGVEFCTYNGGASSLLRWIYSQKAHQFRESHDNIFADERRSELIVNACALDPSLCEVFTYEQGTRIVAALVTFRDANVRRFYTVWFSSAWAKESPGQVLVFEATLNALQNGLDCDYMTGEQPHKTRLATSSEALYRVDVAAEQFRDAVDRMPPSVTQAA